MKNYFVRLFADFTRSEFEASRSRIRRTILDYSALPSLAAILAKKRSQSQLRTDSMLKQEQILLARTDKDPRELGTKWRVVVVLRSDEVAIEPLIS